MQCLDRAEFEAASAEYDGAVAADPAIDRFCSRSAWVLSFHDAFRPRAELRARARGRRVRRARAGRGAGGRHRGAAARVDVGLRFAARRRRELRAAATRARARRRGPLAAAALRCTPRARAARAALAHAGRALRAAPALRDGALPGVARRRRRRLARAPKRGVSGARCAPRARARAMPGVVFASESPAGTDAALAAYERALAIERHTWKTRSGNGVDRGPMCEFYARMLPRLAEARSAARALRRARRCRRRLPVRRRRGRAVPRPAVQLPRRRNAGSASATPCRPR